MRYKLIGVWIFVADSEEELRDRASDRGESEAVLVDKDLGYGEPYEEDQNAER